MNSDDVRALAQLLETIEAAGGDVRDVEINSARKTTSPIFANTSLFSAAPTETVFTLEVAVGDLVGNPLEASDEEVRESVGIDVETVGGDDR